MLLFYFILSLIYIPAVQVGVVVIDVWPGLLAEHLLSQPLLSLLASQATNAGYYGSYYDECDLDLHIYLALLFGHGFYYYMPACILTIYIWRWRWW
jgi:hypothetical protein